ncbi:MAG: sigma-70 family RNA polymerase sigma factor [Streptosporangiaceae bacterium]
MADQQLLAQRFEEQRTRLRAVAYRMLGSLTETDDAVQEAWLRLSRADTDDVTNLAAWLTTVTGRICLDMLRSRTARREEPLDVRLPDPVISYDGDPEHEALTADAVGLALLVVLETLTPAERLAFVLHDLFGVPFTEIGPIVGRTPDAAKMLASRARRRVRSGAVEPDADPRRQREIVEAFLGAARAGDFGALVELLDPDVVLRADMGAAAPADLTMLVRGATAVAGRALLFAQPGGSSEHALVNGAAGVVTRRDGRMVAVLGFTITHDKIVAIDVLADPERLSRLDGVAG